MSYDLTKRYGVALFGVSTRYPILLYYVLLSVLSSDKPQ